MVGWIPTEEKDDPLQNGTVSPVVNGPPQDDKIKSNQVALVAIILLVSVVFIAIISVVVFVFCYRKRLKDKVPDDPKPQLEINLHDMENIPPSSNLIPSEPETPNQTDGNSRTFTYPFPRRRLSSTGSTNSTTPLLKYRAGSYRSRFSSGVSSRIDSNIAEGKERISFLSESVMLLLRWPASSFFFWNSSYASAESPLSLRSLNPPRILLSSHSQRTYEKMNVRSRRKC